jgi:hypothetical protein
VRKADDRIAPQGDPCCLQPDKGRLLAGNRLHRYHIGGGELGVVVQLFVEVQPPLARAIAITQQAAEAQRPRWLVRRARKVLRYEVVLRAVSDPTWVAW